MEILILKMRLLLLLMAKFAIGRMEKRNGGRAFIEEYTKNSLPKA